MMPERPMPDEDRFREKENPDLGRGDDADETVRDERPERDVLPDEEERPETAEDRGADAQERPTITPDDATPTEDPGISPI